MPLTQHPQVQNLRALALTVMRQVLGEKAFASECLDRTLIGHDLIPADRRLLTQLVYGTLREMAWLDACLKPYLKLSQTRLGLLCLLRLATYQMLCLEKVPDYAVLHESVELAKLKFGSGAGKMVNAVLRRLQEQKARLIQEKKQFVQNIKQNINSSNLHLQNTSINYQELGQNFSLPGWLISRWVKRYGAQEACKLAFSFNQVPKLYLRCNLTQISPESCAVELQRLGFEFEMTNSESILALQSLDWRDLQSLLSQGWFSIQDLGSFQIVEKLAPKVGEFGIDACAGKGIKASALAERLGSEGLVSIYEPNAKRLQDLRVNFKRLSLKNYHVIQNKNEFLTEKKTWDWLLVDAPCSGLGTLGRKPEIRWKIRESDIKQHARLQLEILREWSPKIRPGGRLLYAVCSLEPEEGPELIQAFLQKHKGWNLIEQGEIWPGTTAGADGFYWASLVRK